MTTLTRPLRDGGRIPVIGFGVYRVSPRSTKRVVEKALENGYRYIDSASDYDNEAEAGAGIASFLVNSGIPRKDVFYLSKLWQTDFGYAKAKAAIDKALDKVSELGYIDMYLMHSPAGGKETRLQTYRALQEAVQEGKIRHIGVSNWSEKHIAQLLAWPGLKVPPTVNQIEVSPWLQQRPIVDACRRNKIDVIAYAPLTVGEMFEDPELVALSEKYGKSPAQILLRWSTQKGFIPVVKSSSSAHQRENLDVFDFELTESEVEDLGDPDAYLVTDWDPTGWD